MSATVHALYRCEICGKPAGVQVTSVEDGRKFWLCRDHLPEEAREHFDRLVASGWKPSSAPTR